MYCVLLSYGNYLAMWLLNYSGCGTFRDFESDIIHEFSAMGEPSSESGLHN